MGDFYFPLELEPNLGWLFQASSADPQRLNCHGWRCLLPFSHLHLVLADISYFGRSLIWGFALSARNCLDSFLCLVFLARADLDVLPWWRFSPDDKRTTEWNGIGARSC